MANRLTTVFLSSTGKDLHEHRKRAYRAIQRLDGYECVWMEDFGARDWQADDFCRAKVAECDVFVCIVGHRRGESPEGNDESYTEREYDAACDAGRPRLVFLSPEDFPLAADLIESDDKRTAQKEFREKASGERILDTFGSPDDLASRVMQAIHNWAQEDARAEGQAGEGRGKRTFGALPPQPHFAHPYPLQPNFTGRVSERKMLTKWLMQNEHPVLALVAFGGMGKSALAWAWLLRDVLGETLPLAVADSTEDAEGCRVPEEARPEGAFWWSFYESDSTFEGFLDGALAYAADGKPPAGVQGAREKMEALVDLLWERRLLLVLDGFERQLRYDSLEQGEQGDAKAHEVRAEDRVCGNRIAATFLRRLAGGPYKSRVLLVSRLFPKELEGDGEEAVANCVRENLTSMDPADAVAFFHAQGVDGTSTEIEAACQRYDYQPLALRLLARVIISDKNTPGDIQVAGRRPVLPELAGEEQLHIRKVAYEALSTRERGLLSRISAFRSSVDYEAVSTFNTYKNTRQFDVVLEKLTEGGLLLFDQNRARYDLHPLVRSYAYERLRNKRRVHERLAEYFAEIPVPGERDPESVEDLAPVIELYHHTVGAGRYDDARDLYDERLANPLYYRLGAYQTCIELLRALFPDGEGTLPRLANEGDQAWTLNALASSYSFSGQPRRAGPLIEQHNTIHEKDGNSGNLATGKRNLAIGRYKLGDLAAAESDAREALALSKEAGHKVGEALSHDIVNRVLACKGQFDLAQREQSIALSAFTELDHLQAQCVVLAYQAQAHLLAGDAEAALEAARGSRKLADQVAAERRAVERDFVRAEWLIGTSLVALATQNSWQRNKHLAEAESPLTEALSRCRRINLVESEPDILLALARWHQAVGNAQEPRELAEEALDISNRCEYRLQQADVHNFLAALAMEEDDKDNRESAIEHATTGYERAWCDGPPHAYQPALDEAKRLLDELGVAPPEMPAYAE